MMMMMKQRRMFECLGQDVEGNTVMWRMLERRAVMWIVSNC
jgi:hypothetical protein